MHWRDKRQIVHSVYAAMAIVAFVVLVTGLMAYVCSRLV